MEAVGTTIPTGMDASRNVGAAKAPAKNVFHPLNTSGILSLNGVCNMEDNQRNAGCGCGVGGFIAVILSWLTNHSILWALFHAFCGWIYVIYWIFVHGLPQTKH
jgi:hypothetical protein